MPLAGQADRPLGGGPLALFGVSVTALATIPFGFVGAHTSIVWLSVAMFVRGIGIGFAFMPAMAAAFASLERSELPDATPQLNVLQRVGGSIGTAVLAVVLQRALVGAHTPRGAGVGVRDRVLGVGGARGARDHPVRGPAARRAGGPSAKGDAAEPSIGERAEAAAAWSEAAVRRDRRRRQRAACAGPRRSSRRRARRSFKGAMAAVRRCVAARPTAPASSATRSTACCSASRDGTPMSARRARRRRPTCRPRPPPRCSTGSPRPASSCAPARSDDKRIVLISLTDRGRDAGRGAARPVRAALAGGAGRVSATNGAARPTGALCSTTDCADACFDEPRSTD